MRALILLVLVVCSGASYRTANFIVEAPTQEWAQRIGNEAERHRRELAIAWTGKELEKWPQPCSLRVNPDGRPQGSGGVTSFRTVGYFNIQIFGASEELYRSTLPHEVSHAILFTHFGGSLPLWCNEGACTTVEAQPEQSKMNRALTTHLRTGRGIPFAQLFSMQSYPEDTLTLYSHGHSLSSFLISQGGRPKFVQYVRAGMSSHPNWSQPTTAFYGYENLGALQNTWLEWVRHGSPEISKAKGETVAYQYTCPNGNCNMMPMRSQPPPRYSPQPPYNPPVAKPTPKPAPLEPPDRPLVDIPKPQPTQPDPKTTKEIEDLKAQLAQLKVEINNVVNQSDNSNLELRISQINDQLLALADRFDKLPKPPSAADVAKLVPKTTLQFQDPRTGQKIGEQTENAEGKIAVVLDPKTLQIRGSNPPPQRSGNGQ